MSMKRVGFGIMLSSLVLLLAATCGPGGKGKTKAPTVAAKPKKKKAGAKLGAQCVAETSYDRGSCGKGLFCAATEGGMCTSPCPCKNGAVCVETMQFGEICAPSCQSDADCRGTEGYTCDGKLQVCTLAGMITPRPPECAGLPPAKKRFGDATQLTNAEGPGQFHVDPAAYLAKTGELTVVYTAASAMGKPNTLGALAIGTKGGVFDLGEIKGERPNASQPRLVADRTGKMYLFWLGYDGRHEPPQKLQIMMSTSADGKTWSKPLSAVNLQTDCPDGDGCVDHPFAAIGPDKVDPNRDAIYVGYWSKAGGGLKLAKSIDGGASFAAGVKIGPGSVGDIELTASGGIHVAYAATIAKNNMFGDAANSVEYSKSTDGGATFTPPVQVSGTGEEVPYWFSNPQVVPDLDRKLIYVVYPAGKPTGEWNLMLATSKDGGATWSRMKINDEQPCSNHMVPAAVLDDATGILHVIWTENRGAVGGIAYSRCDKNGSRCEKNEGVSNLPFAAYRFVKNSPKYLGEQSALLIDVKTKLVHAIWSQPMDESGQVRGRIFHASAKLK